MPDASISGTVEDKPGTGFNWGSLLTGGATLASSLFAPDTRNINSEVNQIESGASSLKRTGSSLVSSGQQAMGPSLNYFKALASGDYTAILNATAPERGRVIDQYDSARRAAGQFTPRGGGQASSMNESRAREASDLSTGTSAARGNAANTLASIGANQTNAGLSAEEASVHALAATLGPILQQQKNDQQSTESFFGGLAKLVTPLLLAAL